MLSALLPGLGFVCFCGTALFFGGFSSVVEEDRLEAERGCLEGVPVFVSLEP